MSYQVVGASFSVYNDLGGGLAEKIYGNALSVELKAREIAFDREKHIDLSYKGQKIGKAFADYVIDNSLVLELKVGHQFLPEHFSQTKKYLSALELQLGIIILFTSRQVKFRRVINHELTQVSEAEIEYSIKNLKDLESLNPSNSVIRNS